MGVIETPHPQVTLRNWAAGLHLTVRKPDHVDWYTIAAPDGSLVAEGTFEDVELFIAVARDQNKGLSPVADLDVSRPVDLEPGVQRIAS